MKKVITVVLGVVLVVGFLFIEIDGFAADGDLIVNGNVGIGTTTPEAKLDVQGGSVKLGGIFITHVTGTNPTCPSGTYLMRKWKSVTCYDHYRLYSCTTPASWNVSVPTCTYSQWSEWGYGPATCTATTWTETVCMGN